MLERTTRAVLRFRFVVLALWVALAVVGAVVSTRLPALLSSSFAVPGTDSDRAQGVLVRAFGERTEGAFTVVFTVRHPSDRAQRARLQQRLVAAARAVPTGRARQLRPGDGVLYGDIATTLDLRHAKAATPALRRALAGPGGPPFAVTGHAALFHDIGKLAIPDSILLKPGRLTVEERLVMQAHSEEGAIIIGRLGFLADAVPAIRHHHEHFNGGGYPAGLAGEEIPLGSRIIHVADALDSMVTTRIYRSARTGEAALDELRQGTGSQFCPRCVAALMALVTPESLAAADRGETEYVIAC